MFSGLTGRNFAAGMSGGIAYVWDVDGTFSSKCNRELVELCKLEDKDDLELVQSLLREFKELTDSVVADNLLQEFPKRTKEFVKVFPYEYQRVLRQRATAPEPVVNNVHQNTNAVDVRDIEESVADLTLEHKKAERALDKVRGTFLLLANVKMDKKKGPI